MEMVLRVGGMVWYGLVWYGQAADYVAERVLRVPVLTITVVGGMVCYGMVWYGQAAAYVAEMVLRVPVHTITSTITVVGEK